MVQSGKKNTLNKSKKKKEQSPREILPWEKHHWSFEEKNNGKCSTRLSQEVSKSLASGYNGIPYNPNKPNL